MQKEQTKLSALCVQMAANALLMVGIGLAIPRLGDELGLSLAARGSLVTVQFIGSSCAVMIGGALCDRYGKAFVIRVSMLLGVFSAAFFGLSWSFASTFLAVFLLGVVSYSMENAIMAESMELADKNRSIAIVQTFFSFGAALTPIVFFVFSLSGRWRPVYFVGALFSLLGFFLAKGKKQRLHSRGLRETLQQYASYFRQPVRLCGALFFLLYMSAEIGLWTFAPTYFEAEGYGKLSGVVSSFLLWVMIAIGRVLGNRLVKRCTILQIALPFSLLALAAYSGVFFGKGSFAVLCVALTGLGCGPLYPCLSSIATDLAHDHSASFIAFLMVIGGMGPSFVGILGGLTGEWLGARFILLPQYLCIIALVVSLAALSFQQSKNRRTP